ncbi:MAG: 4-hydroxy-tetrahydrodipicolinate reductase [Phycisphaerae bacterium]|nr:4-hydroxy-tetrahydrodipicolinate reductase [Phycisphaerae bacterium]
MVKVAILGACGRMGRRLGTLAHQDEHLQVVCAIEREGHEDRGKDYGRALGLADMGVKVGPTLTGHPQVIIDFTTPESTTAWVEQARDNGIALVIGTTGLGDRELDLIRSAAHQIPIVQAPNMSVGVNLLFRLVGQVAKSLGPEYDIEIVEAHHRFKKDAPSGTALGLLSSICDGIGCDARDVAVFGREGKSAERKKGQIGVHAVRVGDTVGEHTVYFGTLGETVTIGHSAHSRDTFVLGALRAARWLEGKAAGLYSMQDVLFGD